MLPSSTDSLLAEQGIEGPAAHCRIIRDYKDHLEFLLSVHFRQASSGGQKSFVSGRQRFHGGSDHKAEPYRKSVLWA